MPLKDPAFRLIFENVPAGIVIVDADLKVVDANAAYCRMLGYTKDEIVGMQVPDFTHPEDRKRDIEFLPLLLKGVIPHYRAEKRYLNKKGELVWVNLTGTALRDEDGKADYAFALVEDITEKRTLHGLLPICGSCKKVRDDRGYWSEVERYLSAHLGGVSPALCPECARKMMT